MSISVPNPGELVQTVKVTKDQLIVDLVDGRTIAVPLVWYPRLLHATAKQRANWQLSGGGYGIHWPDIDEDLSTEGLLRGIPAPRAAKRNARHPSGERREAWSAASDATPGRGWRRRSRR